MSVAAIAALLSPPSSDEIESFLLAYLSVATNPVTDWNSGAVQLTMLNIETAILASLIGPGTPPAAQGALAGLLANSYPDSSSGDSLATLAHGWFEVEKATGALAAQTVTLACDADHGPYTFSAGLQEGKASDGATYVTAGGGTLSASSTLTIDFQARSVGLAKALITRLARSLPGVSVQSAAIKVVTGVPQFGADADSDATVLAACASRFPDLTAVGDEDRVIAWALAAGTTVTRCRLDPDTGVAGGVILTVANATGPVPGGDVTTVGDYLLARQPITDNVAVQNATAVNVTPGGTVTVPAARAEAVKAAADAAWQKYLSTSQIGAQVYLLALIQAVMDAGASNFADPTLNGSGTDLTLTSGEVPVPVGTLGSELAWVTT